MVTKSVTQLTDILCVSPRNCQKLYSDCSAGFAARYASNRPAAIQYRLLFTSPSYMITHNVYAEKPSVVWIR